MERACRTTFATPQLSVEEGSRSLRRGIVTKALPLDVSDVAVAGAVPIFIFILLRLGVYFRLQVLFPPRHPHITNCSWLDIE